MVLDFVRSKNRQLDSAVAFYKDGLQLISERFVYYPDQRKFSEVAVIFCGNLEGGYAMRGDHQETLFYFKTKLISVTALAML